MTAVEQRQARGSLSARLSTRGLRLTRQRERVYRVLLQKQDHPTADEVFLRAKREMPELSLATVYNCLDALVRCRLVRKVQLHHGASRFCPNMQEHCHFYCDACDRVFDIELPPARAAVAVPKGFRADHYEIAIHGVCPECGGRAGT